MSCVVASSGACCEAWALLTSTLTEPNASSAASRMLSALDCWEISALKYAMAEPSSASSAYPSASLMSTTSTRAPSLTNARVIPRPIPPAPPVTIATLPSSLIAPPEGHRTVPSRRLVGLSRGLLFEFIGQGPQGAQLVAVVLDRLRDDRTVDDRGPHLMHLAQSSRRFGGIAQRVYRPGSYHDIEVRRKIHGSKHFGHRLGAHPQRHPTVAQLNSAP